HLASSSDRMARLAIERNFIGFEIIADDGITSAFACRHIRHVDCDRTRVEVGLDMTVIDPNLVRYTGLDARGALAVVVRTAHLSARNFGWISVFILRCWAHRPLLQSFFSLRFFFSLHAKVIIRMLLG